MQAADFERYQAFGAEVEGFVDFLGFKVPEVDVLTVFASGDVVEVEAGHEGVGCRPLGADHHVVPRLVPEVVVEVHATDVVLPTADDVEVLIEVQEAAWGVAVGVAEHGDDDVGAEAVDGVRG